MAAFFSQNEFTCACNKSECNECNKKYTISTNADRIRSMSDEELAKWICYILDDDCFEEWLDWLRQKE